MQRSFEQLEARLQTSTDQLTKRIHSLEIEMARNVTQREHESEDIRQLKTVVSRLVWLIMSAIVMGGVKFVADGGLNVVPQG